MWRSILVATVLLAGCIDIEMGRFARLAAAPSAATTPAPRRAVDDGAYERPPRVRRPLVHDGRDGPAGHACYEVEGEPE